MTELLIYLTIGLTVGGVYAIAATGLVVTYITSRVFNFAYGALGMFVAYIYYQLRVEWAWPAPLALGTCLLVVAPLIGLVLDIVLMRKLQGSTVAVKLVATLALALAIQGVAQYIWGSQLRVMPPLFTNNTFTPINGLNVTYDQAGTVVIAAVLAVGLWLLFKHTRFGSTMRAVVDDPVLAELNGIDPRRVTGFSWALGTSLAALAAILIAPRITLSIETLTVLVITAFAAAILGKLSSIAWTFVGGLALGISSSLVTGYVPTTNQLLTDVSQAIPFVALFVMLVVFRRERGVLQRTDVYQEPPPPRLGTTLVWTVGATAVVALLAPHLSDFHAYVFATALVFAAVLLTQVLITGMAGQISLAQFTFVGIGAILCGHLSGSMPYAIAVLVSALITACAGALVALPALRLSGLYLALATLAFAAVMDKVFFQDPNVIPPSTQTLSVPTPSMFGFSFDTLSRQLPLLTLFVGLVAILILAIRRGRLGRALTAMRDAPEAAAAFGLNIVRTKVMVFALASGIAGVAGCLYGGIQGQVSASEFEYTVSTTALLILAIQGLTSVTGAIVGAVFYAVAFLLLPQWINNDQLVSILQPILIGLGVLNLAVFPGGAVAQQREQFLKLKSRLSRTRRTDPKDTVGESAGSAVRERIAR